MTASKKSIFISMFATLLSLGVFVHPGAAQSYNPAGDFSLAGNPNGVWSYGWSTTLGSAFNLDSSNTTAYSGISGLDQVG